MNNKEITINTIQTKDSSNIISAEIKDDTETLIAAHNSSRDAHKNTIGKLEERTQALSSIINEIEDNIVLPSEIPAKLSDLENDLNFVSEETLISALEKRNMVTLPQLNEKIEENTNEIKDLIDINSNQLTNKIETLKNELSNSCSPETISNLTRLSSSITGLVLTKTQERFTMPADGEIYFQALSYNAPAWVRLSNTTNTDLFRQGNISVAGNYGTITLQVAKGDIIEASYINCTPKVFAFIYNRATAPKESEET